MNRMQLISNLLLKKWNTSQGLIQLLIEVQEYVIKAASHNIKQERMHKTILLQSPNGISDCIAIKEVVVNQN